MKKFVFLMMLVFLALLSGLSYSPNLAAEGSRTEGGGQIQYWTVTEITLPTRDLVYDPVSQLIYASVPNGAGNNRDNTITEIDPFSGTIGDSYDIGSDPGVLAISDDGQYIYASLDTSASIRRFDVISKTADIQFALGSDPTLGQKYAEDIEVLPGTSESVAVALKYTTVSPRFAGVAVFDDGVQRPVTVPHFSGTGEHVNKIEFSNTSSILYGGSSNSVPDRFYRMLVDVDGVSVVNSALGLVGGGYGPTDIEFDSDRIYATSGNIINPETLTLDGAFPFPANGLVRPYGTEGFVFFLTNSGSNRLFQVYDQQFHNLLASINVTNVSGTASSLITWGNGNLAFRTANNQVFLLKRAPHVVYFPAVLSLPSLGIYGTVTYKGGPVANVNLDLRFFNGSTWSTRASTTTDGAGSYKFTGQPPLQNGQYYYVRYLNQNDPSRLFTWHTALINSYASGQNVNVGNFDVENIILVSPASGATVTLPRIFQWQKRVTSPTDDYEFNLFDGADGDPWFWTDPPLGYVNTYTLNSLPPGFETGTYYLWYMWVYDDLGGFGNSYWANWVAFTNTGSGPGQLQTPISQLDRWYSVELDLSLPVNATGKAIPQD